MKSFLLFALTMVLSFNYMLALSSEKQSDALANYEVVTKEVAFLEQLSEFLTAANQLLAVKATSGELSESDFRNWAGKTFGSVRGFRELSRSIQKNLVDAAGRIGVDINRLAGVETVLNHMLGSQEARLHQIAKNLPDSSMESCFREFIADHQACLSTAILDGLFEYQDWISGANFINCLSGTVRNFDKCID